MTQSAATSRGPSQGEFIALIAMLFATIALSIDSMLPALPEIAAHMTPDNPNGAQFVVGAFFLGMGVGTVFAGPLSDAFGRKTIILLGGVIYIVAALGCYLAQDFQFLLVARVLQGIGAAGPRTVSMAMVRDLYKGREMARIMSFAMMVFMLVPAVAPLMGQAVMLFAGWQTIFLVLIATTVITILWMGLRQPETLAREHRTPIQIGTMIAATKDLFSRKQINVSILIQSLTLGAMLSTISSVQGVFEQYLGQGDTFPLWFALFAAMSAIGSFVNSRVVMRFGMRKVVNIAYAAGLVISLIHLALLEATEMGPTMRFLAFTVWIIAIFAMMSLTMGNLNALAMEPVGHIAGFAASMIAAIATIFSVIIAAPIGQAFDGTPLPLVLGTTILIGLSLALMRLLRQ